jgi:hypothetical protein
MPPLLSFYGGILLTLLCNNSVVLVKEKWDSVENKRRMVGRRPW